MLTNNTIKKSYCLKCKKEVNNEIEVCECGGRTFIFGNKFKLEDNKIICDCGSEDFKTSLHMDFTTKALTNYFCTKCANILATEYYRDESDPMRWEY